MGQRQTREIHRALTWGGRLMVMAPLYSISTQSPREKQQARWVWTRTVCPGAAVADQKLAVPDLQNFSLKDSRLHGFQI